MELQFVQFAAQEMLSKQLQKTAGSGNASGAELSLLLGAGGLGGGDVSLASAGLGSMSGGGESNEFSMLMQLMMLKVLEQQGNKKQSSVTPVSPTLTYGQSGLRTQVFTAQQEATLNASLSAQDGYIPNMYGGTYPENAWTACTPGVTSNASDRSPQRLQAVVEQFQVESNPRYTPHKNGYTYCNIYAWDVTSALGVPLPRVGAVAMDKWLRGSDGAAAGWVETDAATAQQYADAGRPAVTTMGEDGHVQVVVPSKDGAYNANRGVAISQAGSTNHAYKHQYPIETLRYFVHS